MSAYFNKLKDKDVQERYLNKIKLWLYVIDIKKEGVRDVSILPQIDLEIISKYLLEERSWYTGEKFNAKKSMIFLQVQHSVKGKVLNMLDSFWIWKHYLCTLQLHGWAMVVLLTCAAILFFINGKCPFPNIRIH